MPTYFVPSVMAPTGGGDEPQTKRWLSQSYSDPAYDYDRPETRALFEPFAARYNWGARKEDLVDPRFVPMAFSGVFPGWVPAGRGRYLVFNEPEFESQGNTKPEIGARRYGALLEKFGVGPLIVGGWYAGLDWPERFFNECERLGYELPRTLHCHGYTYRSVTGSTPDQIIAWWEALHNLHPVPIVITEYGAVDGNVGDFMALVEFARDTTWIVGECPFTIEVCGKEKWYPAGDWWGSWPVPARMALAENGQRTQLGELWVEG